MLFLTESDVLDLLPMDLAIERVEAAFRAQQGAAVNEPRKRIFLPGVSLHYMAAALPGENLMGLKIYSVSRGFFRFVVLLFDAQGGELLAFIEADQLGRIRTGAASGVAAKYLSRADSATAGVIGSGRQARTQLAAIVRVRKIRTALVYSPQQDHRDGFAREMSKQLGIEVRPAESAEAAVRFGDIVVTATNSSGPVLSSEWLNAGAHVSAVGANMENRREVDDDLLDRAEVIAVDSSAQARIEAGDLIQGFALAPAQWERVAEMWEIIAGTRQGRTTSEDVTLFKSTGIALWDVAAAGAVYRRAIELGRGKQTELSAMIA
ncbi:MAG: ornithine cyclodeaminase family protein [Acidobacteriota bacterium]|nr:ornithine cyclodeaminase family protein [Acidobacteriota bacterium]